MANDDIVIGDAVVVHIEVVELQEVVSCGKDAE